MAAYGRPGDVVRFYDINPAVEPIARHFFSYLGKSRGRVEIVNGDARLSLAAEPPQRYDVLAIDAFSGDAIPVHLITSEALELYRRHVQPGGVIAFHVSNRYLDLAPVVKQLADHAGLKAVLIANGDDDKRDVFSSDWVLVTANQAFVEALQFSKDREDITVPRRLRLWTDDYNSLLPVLRTTRRDDDE
jgi:spermidine synthase